MLAAVNEKESGNSQEGAGFRAINITRKLYASCHAISTPSVWKICGHLLDGEEKRSVAPGKKYTNALLRFPTCFTEDGLAVFYSLK